MLITRGTIYPFCTFRIPFDIVVNALFDYGYNPRRSLPKYMFYKCTHISGPKGSPDMI